jgi:hypothetical protein
MRAVRSRGFRIRSPSSRSEPIEKDSRQESPAVPGFFCIVVRLIWQRETILGVQILSGAILPHAR